LCSDSETGVYKLIVGQEQEMTLTSIVYNDGEEAHQAILSVVLPPNLHYIGTDTKVCIKLVLIATEWIECCCSTKQKG